MLDVLQDLMYKWCYNTHLVICSQCFSIWVRFFNINSMPKANFDGSLRRNKVAVILLLLKILSYIPKEIDNGLLLVIPPKTKTQY